MTMYVHTWTGSLSWRTSSLLILLTCVVGQRQDDLKSCTPSINVEREARVENHLGKTLSLRCPMEVCSPKLPNVTWCKVQGTNSTCEPLRSDPRISFMWEEGQENERVHVLQLQPLKIEDSGYYKCSVSENREKIVSNVIEVNVYAEAKTETTTFSMLLTNSTMSPTASTIPLLQQFRFLLYVLVSAGGLCAIILTISVVVFCHRRRRKTKRSFRDPEPAEEVQFVATPENPENVLEHEKLCSPPGKALTTLTTETTYDNAHLSRLPSSPQSPDEESIVYADLNHEAKRTNFNFTENDDVEYAMVHMP